MNLIFSVMVSPSVLYLNYQWDYEAQRPLQELVDSSIAISIDEYNQELGDQQLYFCRCGYPCYRSPADPRFTHNASGRPAFFAHYDIENHPDCSLRAEKSAGLNYTSEIPGTQIADDLFLTIVESWCSPSLEQEFLHQISHPHTGLLEDELGPLAGRPNVHRMGLQELRTRTIHSVQYIAWHLSDFIDRFIQLPGCKDPELFTEIFCHASQVFELSPGTISLYWGKVDRLLWFDDHLYVAFGYCMHCIYLVLPKAYLKARKWNTENLIGRYIVVSGFLDEIPILQTKENQDYSSRLCLQVIAQEWGASGIVSLNSEKFLPAIDVEFHEPAIFLNKMPITVLDCARHKEKRLKALTKFTTLLDKLFGLFPKK